MVASSTFEHEFSTNRKGRGCGLVAGHIVEAILLAEADQLACHGRLPMHGERFLLEYLPMRQKDVVDLVLRGCWRCAFMRVDTYIFREQQLYSHHDMLNSAFVSMVDDGIRLEMSNIVECPNI